MPDQPNFASLLYRQRMAEVATNQRHWVTINGNHVDIGGDDNEAKGSTEKSHGNKSHGKEDPIATSWRQQAKKMTTAKLKDSLLSTLKYSNPHHEIIQLKQKILKAELRSRGVIIRE